MKLKLLYQTTIALLSTLTGLFLAGFMMVHFFGVSLINFGEPALNWYTKHLDKTNWFIVAAVLLVIFVFIVHMINGFKIMWRYLGHLPEVHAYVADMKYRDSYLWYLQFVTGILLAIFATTHLAVACFFSGHTITTVAYIREQFQSGSYWMSMAILLGALVFHIVCGLRNVIIKYDLVANFVGLFNKKIGPRYSFQLKPELVAVYQTRVFYTLFIFGIALFSLGLHNLFLLQ